MGNTIVESARAALGPVGPYLPVPFTESPTVDQQRDAARGLEAAGYRTTWLNEPLGGKDTLVQVALLLGATERMTFGTGIANIWARAPQTMHGAAALLAQSYPDRFVLGMGVGYPQQAAMVGREFGSPLATMRDYVTGMAAPGMLPAPDVRYPTVLASNGPKMVALGGEITDGAMPGGLPVEFTSRARRTLGPDKLLIAGLPIAGNRAEARARTAEWMQMPRAAAALLELGYPEAEVTDPSDRIVDALVAHGDPASIAAKAREHLAAGADHVMIMLPLGGGFATGMDRLVEIAPALVEID